MSAALSGAPHKAGSLHGALTTARFGRLFPNLPPCSVSDEDIRVWAAEMVAARAEENPTLPAGYTYFAQFVVHDLTFDPRPLTEPRALESSPLNVRTPRFDLDSVYASGPLAAPHLYDQTRYGELLGGVAQRGVLSDLPRNSQGVALVGDPRNDENLIVSQLHAAFLRFHNQVLRRTRVEHPELSPDDAFHWARRSVLRCYHWILLHDLLPRIAGIETVERLLPPGAGRAIDRYRPRLFDLDDRPFVPLEVSGAALRFGHAMVRPSYLLNADLERRIGAVPLFAPAGRDLRGGRPCPQAATIDWSYFCDGLGREPQKALRIGLHLAAPLAQLPDQIPANLAVRNLERGLCYALPCGQAVAERLGVRPIREGEADPLWLYVLREAETLADGCRLGPVGATLVAATFLDLLVKDEKSYVNALPQWRPPGGRLQLSGIVGAAAPGMAAGQEGPSYRQLRPYIEDRSVGRVELSAASLDPGR